MKHKHHIIPRYEGGSDFAENIIELTVTQHAMWHFAEWQRKGNWQDRTAWKMLVGETTEGRRLMRKALGGRNKGKKQKPLTAEQKERHRQSLLGRAVSPEVREKIAAPQRGRPKSPETCKKMSVSAKARTERNRQQKREMLSAYFPLTEESIAKAQEELGLTRKQLFQTTRYYGLR
jgi:transcriptional regulator with GAF, ATPase, and Fis domain